MTLSTNMLVGALRVDVASYQLPASGEWRTRIREATLDWSITVYGNFVGQPEVIAALTQAALAGMLVGVNRSTCKDLFVEQYRKTKPKQEQIEDLPRDAAQQVLAENRARLTAEGFLFATNEDLKKAGL